MTSVVGGASAAVGPDAAYVEARIALLRAGGQVLLKDAQLSVAAGELVLMVGGSGTGKSVLLRVMADLVDPTGGIVVTGEVRRRGRLGVVFQHGALFEQLTLADNLAFAGDHATPRGTAAQRAALLAEVRISPAIRLDGASGGQRRRIAIARALAAAPEILLYDEPTAGLDPDLARHVAALIRQMHDARGMATLVITHDFPALAPVADRIVFLDAKTQSLTQVTAEDLARMVDAGAFRASMDEAEIAPPARAFGRARPLLAALGRAGGRVGGALASSLLPRWRRPAWGARAFGHFLGLVAGPTSLAYVGLAGAVTGCVAVYFSFRYLPYAHILGPLVTEDLLAALGFALFRVLVPILATTLVAARCGAALASDLAGRSYREELAAMRVLGAHPGGLLGFSAIFAITLATPVLVLASFAVARAVGLATYGLWDPGASPAWIEVIFHGVLRRGGGLVFAGTWWVVAKSAVCGLVVGAVAVGLSLSPKRHPDEVSHAVTRTVLVATALVLVVHAAFAFIEF